MAGRRPALTGIPGDGSGERERASPRPRAGWRACRGSTHTRRTTSSHNAGATLSRSVVSASTYWASFDLNEKANLP
jgi:hypothetical protein